ncbi:OmpA family protein [Psychromonas antarctica]|jgi:outer membrane protein OmpA-like peptidoglycan-associated protein|uniref:OmpA family protein n=1 Tax=Psychromonas antarctica TaxID=67573 RepID=UPI001EE938CC|nr:OmpA family protein [Psychromonas antarctica]MCG6201866.1 OmpA family protein [Psychromonas antarctica]
MKQFFIILSLIGTMAVSGCTTFDPYTGEAKTTNTAKGAGIGAGVAMVVSYLANKDKSTLQRNQRMLRDAGIGAIVGGGVGYYMDTQEAKLRKQLRGTGVSVQRDGDNINLVMPGNITFATSKSTLKTDFYDVLDSVALVQKEFDKTIIVVAGYTDSVGSDAYNQQLSEQRARSVSDYLKNKEIAAIRFDTVGFGERNPIADNKTAAGRALNRRVEISMLPIRE